MRIDMTICLEVTDYVTVSARVYKSSNEEAGYHIQLKTDQAKKLRDEITKQLRGASRDKEDAS